ncbi:MAG: M20/M25/M40 family metallo-hydrolase, partial [Pseudomonadota bacterium]
MQMTTKDVLKTMIGFDTVSSKSNLALIDWAEELLTQYGAKCTRYHNLEKTKANLYACFGPEDVPGVVFSGHTDVVPIDGQDWKADPFVMREIDNHYYGRGT